MGSCQCSDLGEAKTLQEFLEFGLRDFSPRFKLDTSHPLTNAVKKPFQLRNDGEKDLYVQNVTRFFKGLVKRCLLLHLQGKIHCDIQPKNIYLQKNGDLQYDLGRCEPGIDLRAVRKVEEMRIGEFSDEWRSVYSDHVISDAWAEIGDWKPHLPKAMIYSLGAVLYYMLAGEDFLPANAPRRDHVLAVKLEELVLRYPNAKKLGQLIAGATNLEHSDRVSWATICKDWFQADMNMHPALRDIAAKLASYEDLTLSINLTVAGVSEVSQRIVALKTNTSVQLISFYKGIGKEDQIPKIPIQPEQATLLQELYDAFIQILSIDATLVLANCDFVKNERLITDEEEKRLKESLPAKLNPGRLIPKVEGETDDSFRNRLIQLRIEKAALIDQSLAVLLQPNQYGPNQFLQHFSKPTDYPLFGLVYQWTHFREDLLNIKRQAFDEWRGVRCVSVEQGDMLYADQEHEKRHEAARRSTLMLAALANPDLEHRLVQLAPPNPRFLIDWVEFARTGQATMYHGIEVSGFGQQRVVYKQISSRNKDLPDVFRESRLLSSLKPNKHVIEPIANLIVEVTEDQQVLMTQVPLNHEPIVENTLQKYFMVSRYIPSGNLRQYVERFDGKMPINKVLFIIKGIIAGMIALREAKITHKDLKADNIMIGEQFVPVIIDLGTAAVGNLAQQLKEGVPEAEQVAKVGTVIWSAPEGVQDQPPDSKKDDLQDSRADIWSIGMILYYMIHGEQAYDLQEWVDLYRAMCLSPNDPQYHRFIDKRPNRRRRTDPVGEALQTLYEQCIVFDMTKRITWASLINHELIQATTEDITRPGIGFTSTTETFKRGISWVLNCNVLHEMLSKEACQPFREAQRSVLAALSYQANQRLNVLRSQEEEAIMIDIYPFANPNEREFFIGVSKKLEDLEIREAGDANAIQGGRLLPVVRRLVEGFQTLPLETQESDAYKSLKPMLGYLMAISMHEQNALQSFTIYSNEELPAEQGSKVFMNLAQRELQTVIRCNGYAFYERYCT